MALSEVTAKTKVFEALLFLPSIISQTSFTYSRLESRASTISAHRQRQRNHSIILFQTVSQSVSQSVSQTINHSINQSINQSISQSVVQVSLQKEIKKKKTSRHTKHLSMSVRAKIKRQRSKHMLGTRGRKL